MILKQYLKKENINPQLSAKDKDGVINELIDLIVRNTSYDKEKLLDAIWKRETVSSTGLENHIAIPHAKTDAVDDITIAIGINKEGIDFNSLDDLPAKIFVMLFVPENKKGPHVMLISEVALLLEEMEQVEDLLVKEGVDEIYDFFTKG